MVEKLLPSCRCSVERMCKFLKSNFQDSQEGSPGELLYYIIGTPVMINIIFVSKKGISKPMNNIEIGKILHLHLQVMG